MGHRVVIHVRYAESDGMGIVHHGAYVNWFEAGRVELMRASALPYATVEARGYAFPVLGISVRYRRACRFGDRLVLDVAYDEVGRTRVRFAYRLEDGEGRIVAEGTSEHACLGPDGRPCRLPLWLREGLRPPGRQDRLPELH